MSNQQQYEIRLDEMSKKSEKRGYPEDVLLTNCRKVNSLSCELLLNPKPKGESITNSQVTCVTIFTPDSQLI